MTKFYNSLKLVAFLIPALFLLGSCSEEEDSSGIDTNMIDYSGNKQEIKQAVIREPGTLYSHLMKGFIMSNMDITPGVGLGLTVFSSDESNLEAGDYQFIDVNSEEFTNDNVAGMNFFSGSFLLDENNDKQLDDSDEIDVNGGTVTITGTQPNYTVIFDLTLENGKTVKGNYSGTFEMADDN